MAFKKYRQAILSWLIFFAVLAVTEIIIGKVLYLPVVNLILGTSAQNVITAAAKWVITWFILMVVILLYYLLLTRTIMGRNWLRWFVHVNRPIFGRRREWP